MDIQIVLGLAGGVSILVEYIKSLASQVSAYTSLTTIQQSILLQTVAFIAGVGAAIYMNVNAFPAFPGQSGVVVTGLLSALGSAGIHVVYAWLGMKGGVSAQSAAKVQSVGDSTYAPFA